MANIIVRLLTLEMASRSAFAVFDEPLEHLDPKNRGFVTTLLSMVTQPQSSIEQLIVTTYEESLTRRIQTVSNPRGTRVSYIA
jgi:ABC-type molybdenum transport system ATPase subunit/photorepair protein PhrA